MVADRPGGLTGSVTPVATPLPATPHRRLPRGPHGLSREEVEQSQRDRLLTGAAEAVAEKGYAATSVADILRRAGVSRTTFYQLFDDKLDCFLAANRMASEVVSTVIADEMSRLEAAGPLTPIERLDRLLAGYLETLVEFPVLARVFLVEVYAAGSEAIEQRRVALEGFVDLVATTIGGEEAGDGSDARVVAEVLVAAVSSMVTNAVGVGRADRLREMHRPLMALATRVLDPG